MNMRLLVFDDDAAIGRLVVRVAALSGLDAVSVTDAAAFEQQLQNEPPNIIMLDLQLGATDGIEQLRRLAEHRFTGSLMLMSGFNARVLSSAGQVGQGLGLNLEETMEKPLQVADLERVFSRLRSDENALSTDRLMKAICNDELSLDFQPVVTRHPRTLKKLEALVRWDHPTLGRVPPDSFLPDAEANPTVIDALTEWVIGAAVESYQILRELGLSVPIAINISTQNLHDLTLPDRLEQQLRFAGMPTKHLCLEITESAAFSDPTLTMDILARARLKGMQLSIDDFGTGYSSLKLLRQMPFSEMKIDQSFVSNMALSRDSRVIVKSIIDLAANMELESVAEGVETEAAATLLESMNVGSLQGFYIARPMPVEAVPAWLAIWTREGSGEPRSRSPAVGRTIGSALAEVPPPIPAADLPTGPEPASEIPHLSSRQLEVMQLLSQGCSVKEIARRLNLGVGTVKVHLSLAYTALGARNRVEAIIRAGLVTRRPGLDSR
jgi:EAL domain-containing protein (putative c-di-GMP-specific phosphodiesterase class I)/DNA-binding NarL/FixJ family response regulator